MIGSRLAHYEITNHLGSGGMGEVYQATDSKLRRNVAIKLLPEALTRNADRVARFEREARVLASLNDPHIAAIYGLEEFQERKFLVMELAPGDTLAQRIARGPIPVNEALAIAAQIAGALEAAHDKGVVHRDLKPANIKVTADGQVKVLDFGLAKAFAVEQAESSLSNSPTLTATASGVIMGTTAYMSPEQAKGLDVDRRTDIFAFGAVLFEMLSGRRSFGGETAAETIARVIEREPDWTSLPQDLPPRVQELLRCCLEKDLNKRRRDAADLRIDIEHALSSPSPTATPLKATSRGRTRVLPWAVAVVLAAALGVTLLMPRLRAPADAPEMRLEIVTPVTSDPTTFAISPDGRQLVVVASSDGLPLLWLRSLAGTTARPLAGTEGATFPFWDSRSRAIGFFADGKLKRVDVAGGASQTVTEAESGRGGIWTPDDVILFAPTSVAALYRVPAGGGEAVAATKLEAGQISHRFPQLLPGGRQFVFYATGDKPGIYLGSVDSMESKRLTSADSTGGYVAPGWLFFLRQGALVAQHLDLSRGELTGNPVTLADSLMAVAMPGTAAFSVSASGLVTYRGGVASRQLIWYDRSGKVLGTWGDVDKDDLGRPEISPDGRHVLVNRTSQNNTDVWMLDADGRRIRLTLDPSLDSLAVWSPDGTQIAFTSNRRGTNDLFTKPPAANGREELLFDGGAGEIPDDWSPDGRYLLYFLAPLKGGGPPDVWVLPMTGEKKPFPLANTSFDERMSKFSPDGRWVAYQSNESGGRFEIYVKPFPPRPGQWLVSKGGGSQARWRRDGKEIYYIALDGKMMAVPITVKRDSIEAGTPVPLFQTRVWGGGSNTFNRQQYDVTPDGRFLIDSTADETIAPITAIVHWKPATQ